MVSHPLRMRKALGSNPSVALVGAHVHVLLMHNTALAPFYIPMHIARGATISASSGSLSGTDPLVTGLFTVPGWWLGTVFLHCFYF